MFKEGDTVICINDSLPTHFLVQLPIKKDSEYTIRNVRRSPCCGYLWVDVGFTAATPLQACIPCNKTFMADGSWWLDHNRFAPVIRSTERRSIQKEEVVTV